MLYFFCGGDREKARAALNKAVEKAAKKCAVLRISDAHTLADVQSAMAGPGMFATSQVVVFDGILGGENEEMRQFFIEGLKHMRDSAEIFFVLEGVLDAATRKQVEKYAETTEKFELPKKEKDNSIFALPNALQRGDKKGLWVGLMSQFAKGAAPEAVHGLLFWGAKKMFLDAHEGPAKTKARTYVALLAELPHEARRRGEDLEYALERFALSRV